MRNVAGLTVLVAVSAWLRSRSLDGALWIDEALSRGIASHDVAEIPDLLRLDASPPLYYVLLHAWMVVAGDSEPALRALSLVFALATVPAAYWAGSVAGGRRCGWIAAVVAALNPFLTIYGQEARMYSLVALLSVLLVGALVRGFVDGERRYQVAFSLVLALLLYTHTWAVFLALGAAAALALLAVRDRAVARPAALALTCAAVAFVPWLPTLLDQAAHTGAPWSRTPSVLALVGGLPQALDRGIGAIVVVGVAAAALVARRPDARVGRMVVALAVLAVVALAAAWLFSQFSPSWANRYLAIVVGPGIVLAALGLERAGRAGLATVAAVGLVWLAFDAPATKSNAKAFAERLDSVPGMLVVSTQPEQVPLLAYYLPDGVRFATPLGAVGDPDVVDWRDAPDRLRAARPPLNVGPLVRPLARGALLVLVEPLAEGSGWDAAWQQLVLERGDGVRGYLERDPRLRRVGVIAPAPAGRSRTNVRAIVFRRL